MKKAKKEKGELPSLRRQKRFRLHPLFWVVGIWYALTGELFLFLTSTLVAVQHECAHAFAAAKLGYKLNAVVLMPFGTVIDGDLRGISLKDEIFVAICGPLCNLLTALFFVAVWWFAPTVYAFTDAAFYSSLSIALVNLLPCYPLDGGRVLKCLLLRAFRKEGEKRATKICFGLTLSVSLLCLLLFAGQIVNGAPNFTLLAFGVFLLVGAFGNREGRAIYERMDFALPLSLKRGVEIKRVAISADCPIKDCFRFLSRGSYLVLEVYEGERYGFSLPQNLLSSLFLEASSPYEKIGDLYEKGKNVKKCS